MAYTRYALILDHADGHLGGVAMRLLDVGIDVLYANDVDEASLLARQEAETLGAVLAPAASSLTSIDRVLQQICSHLEAGPQALVLIGGDPGERTRSELRSRGVRWGLWDMENDRGLRFVMTAAMSTGHEADPRKDVRVPTDLDVNGSASLGGEGTITAISLTKFPFAASSICWGRSPRLDSSRR